MFSFFYDFVTVASFMVTEDTTYDDAIVSVLDVSFRKRIIHGTIFYFKAYVIFSVVKSIRFQYLSKSKST